MLAVEKEWLMSQIGECFWPWFDFADVFLPGLIADCDDDVMDEVILRNNWLNQLGLMTLIIAKMELLFVVVAPGIRHHSQGAREGEGERY